MSQQSHSADETQDASERRSSPRVEKVQLAQVNRFDVDGSRSDLTTGRTLNISRGGVRLELHQPVPLRSEVRLSLVLGERIIDATGTVVYLEALAGDLCGVGVEFNDLDPENEALLEEFVEHFEGAANS